MISKYWKARSEDTQLLDKLGELIETMNGYTLTMLRTTKPGMDDDAELRLLLHRTGSLDDGVEVNIASLKNFVEEGHDDDARRYLEVTSGFIGRDSPLCPGVLTVYELRDGISRMQMTTQRKR